jgi:hypothetical protein
MDEEGGVLGNLPRSRPGRRSDKREAGGAGEAGTAGGEAGTAKASGKASARAARTSARAAESAERQSRKAARPAGQTARRPQPPPPRPAEGGPDPVGEAVRLATGIAGAGLRVANGLTREVLRRLPRP